MLHITNTTEFTRGTQSLLGAYRLDDQGACWQELPFLFFLIPSVPLTDSIQLNFPALTDCPCISV